ncbi:MAG: type III-D CRISPR-associated protein Csx19 [Chloroflexota bacterium]
MRRAIIAVRDLIEPRPIDTFAADPRRWLREQSRPLGPCWLLAHADDWVIWGRVDAERCVVGADAVATATSGATLAPPLRGVTLQSARLFSPRGEILVWRDGDLEWHARAIRQADGNEPAQLREAFDERQILWGDHGSPVADSDFVQLSDGAQGLRHVVPLSEATGSFSRRPLRLRVRHYLVEDEGGEARIVQSRLVNLSLEDLP